MKTPKASTPIVKSKLKTPKLGMVRKSLGSTPVSKVNLSAIKGKEQALSVIEDNEDFVQLVNKKTPKKARMSLPAKLLEKKESKDGFKSPKTPKGKGFIVSTSEGKNETKTNSAQKKKSKGSPISIESENNSSPVKQGSPKANKGKLPFRLDKGSPKQRGSMSPEVQLGLQLEKELSPETLGKKRKNVFGEKAKAKKQAVEEEDQDKAKKQKKKWWINEKQVRKVDQATVQSIFQLANVKAAVTSFLKMKSKSAKAVSEIPTDERNVSIQVKLQDGSLYKKTKKNHFFKVKLLHSILPEKPKVCLITADLKENKDNPDATVAFCEDFLKQKDISVVSQIVTISMFQKQHGEPEKMKKFCDMYDLIFIEARIALVGKIGFKLRKYSKNVILVNLHFNKYNTFMKGYMEGALRMSPVSYINVAQTLSIQCGRLDTESDKLIENIVEVGRYLGSDRPMTGTKELISWASLVSPLSQPVPLYLDSDISDEVAEQKTSKLGKKESSESLKEAKTESKLAKNKENKKKDNLKKPVVKADEEEDEDESDDDEESLGVEVSSVEDEEEGSEVDDDDSEEEEGLDEEVESDEEEEGSGDEESTDEEEIETVEKEYLTDLRKEQDDFQKERSQIIKRNKGGKQDAPSNQINKPQKQGKQQNENKNQKNKQYMNQNRQQQQNQGRPQQQNQGRPQQQNQGRPQQQNQRNQQRNQNRPQQNNQNRPQQNNQNRPQQNSPNFGKNKKPFGGGGNKFGGKPHNQNSHNNQESPNQKSKFEKKNFSKFSKPQGNQQSPKYKKNFNKNK